MSLSHASADIAAPLPPVSARAGNAVRAALTFIAPQDTKPYFESSRVTGGLPKTYFETEDRTVPIHDMRRIADELSLDRQGFELLGHQTKAADLYDDDEIEAVYDPEIEALLRQATGADRVWIFDHTRRSDGPGGAANRDGLRGPAGRVHVDYTVNSGPRRAREILGGEEVDRILGAGGRIAQVNVWRPIRGPVKRAPLALADARSVEAADLVATDQVFPDRVGEIYHLAHSASQRWYWAPLIERDEVLLIKGWDSLEDGRARFTPHSAFALPGQTDATPARESIEVRAYLVFEG